MSDNDNELLKALSQQFHDEMKTASSDEHGEVKSPRSPRLSKHDELERLRAQLGASVGPLGGNTLLSIQTGEIYMRRYKQLTVGEVPDGMIVPPPDNSPAGMPNPQAGRKK